MQKSGIVFVWIILKLYKEIKTSVCQRKQNISTVLIKIKVSLQN